MRRVISRLPEYVRDRMLRVGTWLAAVVLVSFMVLELVFGPPPPVDAGPSGTEVFAKLLHRGAERWAEAAAAERAAAVSEVATASPAAAEQTVTTRVRHVTTLVVPPPETLAEVVVGDTGQWDVSSTERMVFIRPLAAGAASNLLLLTAAGEIVPLLVVEDAAAAIDTVVRVETGTAARRGVPAVHPVAARITPAAEEAGP